MADASLTFRGETLDFWPDTPFLIWLRLLAINLDEGSHQPPLSKLRSEWFGDTLFIEFSSPSLDAIDNDIEAIERVLKTAARLIPRIEQLGGHFNGAHLNLLGLKNSWPKEAKVDTADILRTADRFVRLISQHQDIIEAIIQRHTDQRPRLGPPCPYCGINLWHPKGQQCLECGWDWHNAANPVQHTPGPGRGIKIACLEDGGNPFDERGSLRSLNPNKP